jgi:uncharacterized protein (TIGR03083 family)
MGVDTTEAYRAIRDRTTELVRTAGPAAGARPVPACPQWTVRDVTAHLAGICDDLLSGRLEGVTTDPWTAAQVAKRADRSVAELLDEWAELAPLVEVLFGDGGVHPQMVFDAVTHEHDIRAALDRPGARDSAAVDVAFDYTRNNLSSAIQSSDAPVLRLVAGGGEWVLGAEGPAVATLTATPFDVVRSCSGRRTFEQVAALDWGGADPTPWTPMFTLGPFTLPDEPVETPDAG